MEEEFYIAESDLTPSMKALRFYFHRLAPLAPRLSTRLFWHLFTQPRPRKFSGADETFYQKAASQEMTSAKFEAPFTLHQRGEGEKKVLVLHGWEGRSADFSKLVAQLEENATVFSLDFPGHGKSPKSRAHLPMFKDVIHTALTHLGTLDTVVGHSLGAASLAMTIGKGDFSDDVNKLVFLGLHPIPSQYFLQYKKVTKVSDRIFERCVKLAEEKTGAQLLDYSCYNYLEEYNKYNVHLIHDANDKIIKVQRVEELNEQLAEAQLFKGNHGGHFRHYKDQEVIDRIKSIVHSND